MLPPPDTLASLAAANFAVHAGWVHARSPGMTAGWEDGLFRSDSGTDCDTYNIILGARLEPGSARDTIRRAIARFGGRPFSWWVAPGDEPNDLADRLEAEGLLRSESELAMALSLEQLGATPEFPTGLRVARATTPAALADFARVSAANWTPPDARVIDFYRRAERLLLSPCCPFRLFVGYIGEAAVAASQGTWEGDVVGLYNISTLERWRRRGLGTALTLAPLLDARESGRRIAVLQAAPDGVGVYRRLGFTEFGTITEYKPA